MKLVKYYDGRTFKDNKGNERESSSYYLVLENGRQILIKPVFSGGYRDLDVLAEVKVKEGYTLKSVSNKK